MSGPTRTNIFARLVTELDNEDPSKLIQRELGINKQTGIMYYKDSDGVVRSLDVTSLVSDIRNSVNRELMLDNTRINMIGSGYTISPYQFVDRTEFVKPTLLHSIKCTSSGLSTNYTLVVRREDSSISDYVELPNLYANSNNEDTVDFGMGTLVERTLHEYTALYSRVEKTNVDMFLITNKKHFDNLAVYPSASYEIVTSLGTADTLGSIGKVYYDNVNKDVYIIVAKGTIVTSITYPMVVTSELESPVTKNVQPFIPYVNKNWNIEVIKTYKIDTYSDENGEIIYPSTIDVDSVLIARSDISGVTVSNIGLDKPNFKLTNMQPNTSYYILLQLNNSEVPNNNPEVIYYYTEFYDVTLPNIMMAIDSLSNEFQHLRPSVIQIVEEYSKDHWDGFSPGFMEASFILKTSATTFKIKTPLHDYDEASDICLLFKDGVLMVKNQDYRIFEENDEIFIEKLIDGVVDATIGWPSGILLKAVVLIKTGVTDKNIIYRTYESSFKILHPDTVTIPIGIAEYNMDDEDILMVSQDNSMLFKSKNYSLKSGTIIHGETEYIGPYIELVDCTAGVDTWFFFFVIKASRSIDPVGTIDPKRIRKGLTLDQFEGDLARNLITPNTILDKSIIVRPNKGSSSMVSMVDAFMFDANKNGHLVIRLPFGWVDTDIALTIDVKPLRNSTQSFKIELSGFLSADDYFWQNTSALMITSGVPIKVTLAYYDGRACIILGNSDTHWDKTIIRLSNLVAIGEKLDGWNTGWSYGIYDYAETTALGLTSIFLPEVKSVITNN